MSRKMFKDFVAFKESNNNDWKTESKGKDLVKGFVPPKDLRPIVAAFKNSNKIKLSDDTSHPTMMSKKDLYLVGGPVRDFLRNKTPKDLDLATPATPSQIAIILSAHGFKRAGDNEMHMPEKF